MGSLVRFGSGGTLVSIEAGASGLVPLPDDSGITLGADKDTVLYHRSSTLGANTALTNVLEGTPVTPALAANSLIISNITDDGDILIAASDAGNSKAGIHIDGSVPAVNIYNGQLQTALTLNGHVFDAGSGDAQINTTGAAGLIIKSTDTGVNQSTLTLRGVSSSPANNDIPGRVNIEGENDAAQKVTYGQLLVRAKDVTDTTEDAEFQVYLISAGTSNTAFKIDGAGELYADADGSSGTYLTNGVNLFDEYDDVEELRKYQLTIANTGLITEEQRLANRKRMVELGIWDEKDTGSGYMMRFQPMMRLLAGGIWQTRGYIDALERRIEGLENKLATA